MLRYRSLIFAYCFSIILLGACKTTRPTTTGNSSSTRLIKECPDSWIVNQMPSTNSGINRKEYFIYKGERREVKEFDMNWIHKNCTIQPQYVQ